MLHGVTRCFMVLNDRAECYMVLQSSSGVSWCSTVFQGVTWCFMVEHDLRRCYNGFTVFHGVTLCYTVLQGVM